MSVYKDLGISLYDKPVGETPLAMRQEPERPELEGENWFTKQFGPQLRTARLWSAYALGFRPTKVKGGKTVLAATKHEEIQWGPYRKLLNVQPGKPATLTGDLNKEDLAELRRIGTVWKANRGQYGDFVEQMRMGAAVSLGLYSLGQAGQAYLVYRSMQDPAHRFGPQTLIRLGQKIPKYELGKTLGGGTTRLLEQPRGMAAYPEYVARSMKGELVPRPPPVSLGKEYKLSPEQSAKLGSWFGNWLSNHGLQIAPETQQAITKYTAFSAPSYQAAKHSVKDISRMLTNPMTGEAARQAFMGVTAALPSQLGAIELPGAKVPEGKQPWEMTKAEFQKKIAFHGGAKQLEGEVVDIGDATSSWSEASKYGDVVYMLPKKQLAKFAGGAGETVDYGMTELFSIPKGIKPLGELRQWTPTDIDTKMEAHKLVVQQALAEGKTPYKGWEKDYPDLAKKPPKIKGTPELPDNTVELFGGLGAVAPSALTAPLNQATKMLKNRLMEMFLKYESLRRLSPGAARAFEGLEYGAFESKDKAVKFVGNIQSSFKLSNEQLPKLADVIELGKRQPAIFETAPQNVQDAARVIININEWFESELKKRPGIYPGKFPDGQIRILEAKIAGAETKLHDIQGRIAHKFPMSRAGKVTKVEQHKINKLREEIVGHQEALKELRDPNTLLPVRFLKHLVYTPKQAERWLAVFEKGLPKIRASRKAIGVGRKVATTKMLRELGIAHEENPLIATGQYMWRAMTEMRKYDFLEGFKQDSDLVRQKDSKEAQDPDFRPVGGWIKGANLPQYKDFVVHKAFAQALAEYASPEEKTALGKKYDKLNRTLKQIKFYNFFIMTLNNLQQGLITGSMMPFHTKTGKLGAVPFGMSFKWAKDAWVMHVSESEEYKNIEKLGLFSMPIPRETEVMHSLKTAFDQAIPEAKASKLWMERTFGIKIDEHFWSQWMKTGPVRVAAGAAVGGFAAGPVGVAVGGLMAAFPKEFYHANRNVTWTIDRLQRLMSYFKYRAEGLTMEQSVTKAKTVHADYDMLNKKTAMWLTRVLLTPKYKGAMLKMYKNMVVSFGSEGGRKEYMGADTPSFKPEAARYAGIMIMLLLGLSGAGFRLTQWYRATRATEDEEGKPKEEVHVVYGPIAEPLKYLGRARVGQPISSMKDLQGRMATLVYPYTAVPVHAYWSWMRNRDWKGDVVYSEGADFFKEQLPSTFAFFAREIYAPLSQVEVMSEQDRTVKENALGMLLITLYKRGEIQGYVRWKLRERAGQLRTTNYRDEKQGILTDERIAEREKNFDAWANKFVRKMMEYERRQGANRWDLERMYGPVPHISEKAVAKRRKELEKPRKRKKKKKVKKERPIHEQYGISIYQ